MNSPTIAAVVPGIAPQADRAASTAGAAEGDGPRFAEVLTGQAPAAAGRGPADVQTEGRASDDASSDQALDRKARADDAGEKSKTSAQASEPGAADAAVPSALPQIALEIALHALGSANRSGKGLAQESLSGSGAPVIRSGGPDRGIVNGKEALTATMRPGAIAAAPTSGTDTPAAGGQADSAMPADGDRVDPGARRAVPIGLSMAGRHEAVHPASAAPAHAAGAMTGRLSGVARASGAPAPVHAGNLAFAFDQTVTAQAAPAARDTHIIPPIAEPPAPPHGALAGANPFAAPGAPALPAVQAVATPLQHPGWDADFGRQVITLAHNAHSGTQTAELRLDPPELGPLRISISLNDGTANAVFVSAHASVRQAVESALPLLNHQLAQAGISLGQTHVGDQGQSGFASQSDGQAGSRSAGAGGGGPAAPDEAPPATRGGAASNGLVDTFA